MKNHRFLVSFALALAALALGLRLCRQPEPPPPVAPVEDSTPEAAPEFPPPAPPPPDPPEPRALQSGPERPSPERLADFVRRLGRARLLRDRRTLAALRAEIPSIYPSDVPWLRSRLQDELFIAAGAAEMIRLHRLFDSVPELGEIISHPAHPFLKDIAIETLGALGTDAAAVVVLAALKADPSEVVRLKCAKELVHFGGPESYHALVAALRDRHPAVRSAAADALRLKRLQNPAQVLLDAMAVEGDSRVLADLAVSAYAAGGKEWKDPILEAIESRPEALKILRKRIGLSGAHRYQATYPPRFFEQGGETIPVPPEGRLIGLVVELGDKISLQEVAEALFVAAPLDRYRNWFYFRKAEEFPAPLAYDSYGIRREEVPFSDLDGAVFIRFRDPDSFREGVLGFARGCEAHVTRRSLLHEFGHAFAQLADEYPKGSTRAAANISEVVPAPWEELANRGFLPGEPVRRDDSFFIPSAYCHMGNRRVNFGFCPVCQLQIHARMAELAGAPLPWGE